MDTTTTIVAKEESLYFAYAPERNISAWGGCRDEALNNLHSAVGLLQMIEEQEELAETPTFTA